MTNIPLLRNKKKNLRIRRTSQKLFLNQRFSIHGIIFFSYKRDIIYRSLYHHTHIFIDSIFSRLSRSFVWHHEKILIRASNSAFTIISSLSVAFPWELSACDLDYSLDTSKHWRTTRCFYFFFYFFPFFFRFFIYVYILYIYLYIYIFFIIFLRHQSVYTDRLRHSIAEFDWGSIAIHSLLAAKANNPAHSNQYTYNFNTTYAIMDTIVSIIFFSFSPFVHHILYIHVYYAEIVFRNSSLKSFEKTWNRKIRFFLIIIHWNVSGWNITYLREKQR